MDTSKKLKIINLIFLVLIIWSFVWITVTMLAWGSNPLYYLFVPFFIVLWIIVNKVVNPDENPDLLSLQGEKFTDLFNFQSSLIQVGKDPQYITQNSSECMQKAEEGKIVVMKGDALQSWLFWLMIVFAVTSAISNIYTVIPSFSVILLVYVYARNKKLILHPEGFLIQKNFSRYCQKWENLDSPPRTETIYGYRKLLRYLIFEYAWGINKIKKGKLSFPISFLKLTDIRNLKSKQKFLEEITSKFYEDSK